jgi:hypothetical protein
MRAEPAPVSREPAGVSHHLADVAALAEPNLLLDERNKRFLRSLGCPKFRRAP